MRALAALLLAAAAAFVLCACDDDGRPAANRAPTVAITSGAAEAQNVHYRVEFFWLGTDPDGPIDHYEYAVDDTTEWTVTESTSQAFLFSADSLAAKASAAAIVTSDFHRWHSFRVRAVDGHGARSAVERRTFNAFTIAPVTRITSPEGDEIQLVNSPRFRWSGFDDDGGGPDKAPVAYRYKLVRVDDVSADWATGAVAESLGVLRLDGSVDPSRAGLNWALPDSVLSDPTVADSLKKEWIEVPAHIETIGLHDLSERGWAFAIRAVDEAGAVEPEYVRNDRSHAGNVHVFYCVPVALLLTVCEPSIGCHTFPSDGPVFDMEIAAGAPLRLGWRVNDDEEGYAFNYGWDIPDPSSDRMAPYGEGGWIGWGAWTQMLTPKSFPASEDGAIHHFYFKVRDAEGRTQMGIVRMSIVAFRFDKKMLVIDDYVNVEPPDDDYDEFVAQLGFGRMDSTEVTWINGPKCAPSCTEPPPTPSLSMLSRYETVVVYHQDYWREAHSVLAELTAGDNPNRLGEGKRTLATYVRAGGNLWVWGVDVTSGLTGGDFGYPKEPLNPAGQTYPDASEFDTSSFLYRILHLEGGAVERAELATGPDAFIGARVSQEAEARGYPQTLEIDRARFPQQAFGIAGAEAVVGPPLLVAGLDTLYTYVARVPPSRFNGRPAALFYYSPRGSQGSVVYFGFDLYYIREEQVRALCGQVFEDLTDLRQ